jgi:hypothetical protein
MPALWTVHVVLHAENRLELRADKNGLPMHVVGGSDLSFAMMLEQLEAWFGATEEGADIALTLRSPNEAPRVMATRRWRVALYFILAAYERAFVARRGPAPQPSSSAANDDDAANQAEQSPSTRLESGPVSTDALNGIPRSTRGGGDR